MKRTAVAIIALAILASGAWAQKRPNLVPNPGFEEGLAGWSAWGPQKGDIGTYKTTPAAGKLCARIPAGDNAVYCYVATRGGHAYRVGGKYRLGDDSAGATVNLNYVKPGGGNGSAGSVTLTLLPGREADKNGWASFEQVVVVPKEAAHGQFVLGSGGEGLGWYDDLTIEEVPVPAGYDPEAGAWDGITKTRTQNPLFQELLAETSGDYAVTSWGFQLYTAGLPEATVRSMTPEKWKTEMETTFRQMGESHLGALALPWAVTGSDSPREYWRNEGTLKELNAKYKLQFDCAVEGGAVEAAALKAGAEVLNKGAVDGRRAEPRISLLDPKYTEACVTEIEKWGRMFGDEPYCRAFEGRDEPMVATLSGKRASAGAFMAACDAEVREKYGFGKYGMPAPADPSWWAHPQDQPFAWIAFNHWASARYADATKTKYDATKRVVPTLPYTPGDLWFVNGFVPFDVNRMSKYSDYLQADPYASGAEVRRGRGAYNHGFAAKLLRDLGAKHVQIVVQAFDYAGYNVTPQDVLEWSSQALRSGADRLSFYAPDNPRFTDPARWKTMLNVAKTVSQMKAIKRPTATKTAIFYSSLSHRAEGPTCQADELYTAYALLGETVGSWFDFVSDLQIERGSRKLSDYKVIYLPLGTYQDEATIQKLTDWVKAGGTLVCMDPTVWSFGPDGADLSARRVELFGINSGKPKEVAEITAGDKSIALYPRHTLAGFRASTARSLVEPRGGVSITGKYPDGTAAIATTVYGNGKAILFGANPLVPDILFNGAGLVEYLTGLQKAAGEPTGLDVWRFRLPEGK